jgi:hypothetical protein
MGLTVFLLLVTLFIVLTVGVASSVHLAKQVGRNTYDILSISQEEIHHMITDHKAHAQTVTNGISIMGLNSSNIDSAIDHQQKLMYRAKLNNATLTVQNELTTGNNLLVCVQSLVIDSPITTESYRHILCDSLTVDAITNHEFGNNQAMIALAHAVLQLRGIE